MKSIYGSMQAVRLEAKPETPSFTWEKQDYAGLADGIEIYKTTSQLNGRNFNAWYAVADLWYCMMEKSVQTIQWLMI